MFSELKETMKWTANKRQEETIEEIRKLQTEMAELKNLVSKIKN